jgi:hypothetical protein
VGDKRKDGGEAFPVIGGNSECFGPYGDGESATVGMSLRDYFAAKVLEVHPHNAHEIEEIARYCYKVADAMLAEREK